MFGQILHSLYCQRGAEVLAGVLRMAVCLACLGAACAPMAGPSHLSIYASLPLNGPSASRAQQLLKGFRAALADRGDAACSGRYGLRVVEIDNATDGVWDATVEAAAANKAAADSTAIGFLGTFEPGPLLVSLPILNKAGPMLVVAPMNTYPAFTFPVRQGDEPNEYYPSGTRNLVRLGPTDFEAGAAAARWAARAGASTVYVLYDVYDPTLQGLNVARGFELAAASLGLQVVGSFGVDRFAAEYASVMAQIGQQDDGTWPSLIFYAGPPADHLAALFAAKQDWLGDADQAPALSVPGFAAQEFAAAAGPAAEDTYVISPALPVAAWPPAGQAFAESNVEAGLGEPGMDALYGYGAATLLADALEAACAPDRRAPGRGAVLRQAMTWPALTTRLPVQYRPAQALPPADEFGIYRIRGGALDFRETIRADE